MLYGIYCNEAMASVKKNFGYNLILTFCNYLFPLLTYPYVSRVLGVNGIGACNYVDSIINYFILFAQLGIGSYGVREIARCKNNQEKRNEVFNNLFFVNVVMFIIASVSLVICTYNIPSLSPYKDFLLLGLIKLVFSLFLIEWFFQGIEQFKYITIRSVIVRMIYVISVFVFVHDKTDIYIYYGLTSLIIVLNAVFNWNYSRKFRTLSLSSLHPSVYITPILIFGYYRILTSMYTTFNVMFLGWTSGDTEVGYFTTATKLYTLIMSAFTAFTTVMVPRVSQMLNDGKKKEVEELGNKTLSFLAILAFPLIAFCVCNSHLIIRIIAGSGYEGAEFPFCIVMFLLMIIGSEQIVIQQFLMANKKSNLTFVVSTIGALVGLSLNFAITPHLQSVGSAIAWGGAELSVLITGIILLHSTMKIHLNYIFISKTVVYNLIYFVPVVFIQLYTEQNLFRLILTVLIFLPIFVLLNNFFLRNELYLSFVNHFDIIRK